MAHKKDKEAIIIGAKIKQLRMLSGMTQEQLSEKIGIDNKRLSRIETGTSFPSVKITSELSKVFNFNFYELVGSVNRDSIDIPDSFYVQSLNILNSASNKQEKRCYLEALRHTQKCLNISKTR